MPDKCFVPGCKSGYDGCSVKVTMFKPPSETLLLEKWRRAIPRADRLLGDKDRVCELHFGPHLIQRTWRFQVGNDVSEIPRARPKLNEGAVPHLFPNCPAYLSKRAASKRKCRDRSIQPSMRKRSRQDESESCSGEAQQQPQNDVDVGLTFDLLCSECASLCPASFNSVCVGSDCVCFGKLDIVDGQMTVVTSVSMSRDMKVEVYHKGLPAAILNSSQISSRQQLMSVFHRVEMSHECVGNPDQHLVKAISKSRIGILDNSNVWRHNGCTRLTLDNIRCTPCRKFRHILRAAALRTNVIKKLRMKATRLRTVHRLQKRVNLCRVMAGRLKQQLKQVKGQKLDELVKDLPYNQQLAVKHCLQQLNVKSVKGMRYDRQWILSCILLRIKSPKAYAHLRDHCFLSLPSPSTLARYIDVVHVETGVSTQMINLLGNKVSTASQRHGILIFDEIHLREGMRFSTKVLEFEGLVDFGEFTPNAQRKRLADTGLVFMYRPIQDGWVQTVGVFLSKGPTPASVLSKLLLKLLIALESHGLFVCICFKVLSDNKRLFSCRH
jgi:hypothetical protein